MNWRMVLETDFNGMEPRTKRVATVVSATQANLIETGALVALRTECDGVQINADVIEVRPALGGRSLIVATTR